MDSNLQGNFCFYFISIHYLHINNLFSIFVCIKHTLYNLMILLNEVGFRKLNYTSYNTLSLAVILWKSLSPAWLQNCNWVSPFYFLKHWIQTTYLNVWIIIIPRNLNWFEAGVLEHYPCLDHLLYKVLLNSNWKFLGRKWIFLRFDFLQILLNTPKVELPSEKYSKFPKNYVHIIVPSRKFTLKTYKRYYVSEKHF